MINLQKYPVLYLLHGGGGDEEVWLSRDEPIHYR
jgi:pimeloyl-ACP methyl ester carboxylesterase